MTLKILAGKFKNTYIKTPKKDTRPTTSMVKEALFNLCQNEVAEATCLDLFSGSGNLGIEAISRGAKYCVFVDKNRDAAHIIKENIQKLHLEKSTYILCTDAYRATQRLYSLPYNFNLVFIDPPYEFTSTEYQNLLEKICTKEILADNCLIFLERKEKKHFETISCEGLISIQNKKYGNTLLQQFIFKY